MNKKESEVYQNTLKMFDYCCAICGNNSIQMHHIIFGNLRGGRKTYMGNVIPLCKHHHDMAHKNKLKYMDELLEIVNKKMEENGYARDMETN